MFLPWEKSVVDIIGNLKWAPFREHLIATLTTLFLLIWELKNSLPHFQARRYTRVIATGSIDTIVTITTITLPLLV